MTDMRCGFLLLVFAPLAQSLSTRKNQPVSESLPSAPRGVHASGFSEGPCAFGKIKERAMEEAGLKWYDLSFYGAYVPKVPHSTVNNVAALKTKTRAMGNQTYRFNFQGSIISHLVETVPPVPGLQQAMALPKLMRRAWVREFVRDEFGAEDFLVITDPQTNHTPQGPYDHTRDAGQQTRDEFSDDPLRFDNNYWQHMVESRFTLCPGGDSAWSMRFYEAILAGSIPVIHSEIGDLASTDIAFWFKNIGYKYFTDAQVKDLKLSEADLTSIAHRNLDLLLKYQTFIHGDQVPSAYSAYEYSCASSEACSTGSNQQRCEPGASR